MSYPLSNLEPKFSMKYTQQSPLCSRGLNISYMLVYEKNTDVFSLGCEVIKGLLDGRILGLAIHNEEVLLRIGRRRHMLR